MNQLDDVQMQADYMLTLCGDFNYIEFISNSKSGQFFFYSHDGKPAGSSLKLMMMNHL